MNRHMSTSDEDKEKLRFYRIFEKNRLLIGKVLLRFSLGSAEIEDVTQETLLRALQARERQDIHHPRQFMISIAKNVAREMLRQRARETMDVIEDCAAENHSLEEPSPEEALDSREKLGLFAAAVANLPPQCRRVFVMKHVYGASHKEIAAKLGISISTVEKHVAHGLKTCRDEVLAKLNAPDGAGDVQYLFDEARRIKQ